MTAGERHRLAMRVARAARLADSPIGYYHAHADVRAAELNGVEDLDAFYHSFYGDVWIDAGIAAGELIAEVTA